MFICITFELYLREEISLAILSSSGLPRSGKNIWKMKFFPGQEKVREICGWPGNKWLWQAVFRKFIYSVQEGKGCSLR